MGKNRRRDRRPFNSASEREPLIRLGRCPWRRRLGQPHPAALVVESTGLAGALEGGVQGNQGRLSGGLGQLCRQRRGVGGRRDVGAGKRIETEVLGL